MANSTAVVALALAASATLSAQRGASGTNSAGRGAARTQAAQDAAGQGQLRVTKVRPNIYMLTGAGGNITVMPFDLGAVVVDTGSTAMADRVLETITQLSPKPIANILNTSATADHVGGNETLHDAGRRLPFEIIAGEGPMVIAHEKVLTRMSAPTGRVAAAPEKAWPNETYHVDYKKLAAEYRGGEMIVPGHGRLCDMADVAYYRDMLTIIRDLVQDMIKKGMTLEQVKTAKPTFPWDGRYGSTSGPWTTDMFVEAVYRTLSPKK